MAEADCAATTAIAVQRGSWADPAIAAMVAPPVTVSCTPVGRRPLNTWRRGQLARARANMPMGRHRRPTR
jgi:hypothetical protein